MPVKTIQGALLLCILIGGLVLAVRFLPKPPALCDGCNVILISIDTLGAKHTSVYNSLLDTTPFLAHYASEQGVVFENAYSQAPWTLPSHSAMFTGAYPWKIGIWETTDPLPNSAYTIAEHLKAQGYSTAAFSDGGFVNTYWNLVQGFDEFYGSEKEVAWDDIPKLFEESATWLTKREDTTKPFFLLIRPFGIHDPYGDIAEAPSRIGIDHIVEANTREGGATEAEAEAFKKLYRDDIRIMDGALETFFKKLETLGLKENTVVIVLSDHGEEFNEHGTLGFHSVSVYRENIFVPFIIFAPNLAASRIKATIETRAVAATIADVVGASDSRFGSRQSLVPFLTGKESADRIVLSATTPKRDELLKNIAKAYRDLNTLEGRPELAERTDGYGQPYAKSVLQGPWHLITTVEGKKELYHFVSDPEEQTDMYPISHTFVGNERDAVYGLVSELFQFP